MTTIVLDPAEARALMAVCRRQLSWDARLPARVVTTATAFGFYTAPPLDVLVFTAVPADVQGDGIDTVTSLSSLTLALEQAADGDGSIAVTQLPAISIPVTAAMSVAILPPADDWQMPMHAVAGDLAARVDLAVVDFEARAKGVPPAAQEAIAKEIWDANAWAGVPMRTLHAARKLGMLGNDSAKVSAATNGDWRRLATRRGQVFSRVAPRLPLRVVR